jgi:hypothetical protein
LRCATLARQKKYGCLPVLTARHIEIFIRQLVCWTDIFHSLAGKKYPGFVGALYKHLTVTDGSIGRTGSHTVSLSVLVSRSVEGGSVKKYQTNDLSEHADDQRKGSLDTRDLPGNAASNPVSRRSFLGGISASSAAAVAGVELPSLLRSESAKADDDGPSRRGRSYEIRVEAAAAERSIPAPRQVNNGDERRYANFIGNYSQIAAAAHRFPLLTKGAAPRGRAAQSLLMALPTISA